jgi:hypothetical protein
VVADLGKLLESKAGADCKMKTSCGEVFRKRDTSSRCSRLAQPE